MNSCPDPNSGDDYLRVNLNPPFPIPFESLYIKMNTKQPHDVLYFVRVYGCNTRQVSKEVFYELLEYI